MQYEQHIHEDSRFPLIFHDIWLSSSDPNSFNWHESPEVLCVMEGTARIQCGSQIIEAVPGDTVITSRNEMHMVSAITDRCHYYCLIVDALLYKTYYLALNDLHFQKPVRDAHIAEQLGLIAQEMEAKPPYYKGMVRTLAMSLLLYLARHHALPKSTCSPAESKKAEMVRQGMEAIHTHYQEPVSTQDICRIIGFSQCYFSHVFKEFTGLTILEYLNYIRCKSAQCLLSETGCTIRECAEQCGFLNTSYFTRLYKRWFGVCPSQTVAQARLSVKSTAGQNQNEQELKA